MNLEIIHVLGTSKPSSSKLLSVYRAYFYCHFTNRKARLGRFRRNVFLELPGEMRIFLAMLNDDLVHGHKRFCSL